MSRWIAALLAATVVGALCACDPFRGDRGGWCTANSPADPIALSWSEDVDDFSAAGQNYTPPRLEVMSDGRVIAEAVRVSLLTRGQVAALVARVHRDLGSSPTGFRTLSLYRQDGHAESAQQRISLWVPGEPKFQGVISYLPVPLPTAFSTSSPIPAPRAPQLLDPRLPPDMHDALDQLIKLTDQTLAHGSVYQSSDIDVLVTLGDATSVPVLPLTSANVTVNPVKAAWPKDVPRPPASEPGDASTYAFQHLPVTGAGVSAARRAFVEYLVGTGTLQAYDDGIPGQHYSWYGVWRPLTPSEADPSLVPVVCRTDHGSPRTASTSPGGSGG